MTTRKAIRPATLAGLIERLLCQSAAVPGNMAVSEPSTQTTHVAASDA